MARMHSRKHGKSGSKKPTKKVKLTWVSYEKDEINQLIVKLVKEGKPNAEIGIILRDQYGIPDVREFGLRVAKVADTERKKEIPEDLFNLIKKAVNMHKHMGTNKKDTKNKHSLELIESKVRRLGKYYVKKGKLPKDWKYTIEKAKLWVK